MKMEMGYTYFWKRRRFVHAEHLYIPRMGKCGNPYESQIFWLKDILYRSLPNRDPSQVILVKRNHKRALQNFDAVKSFVYAFAIM